jgi:hypothetical protein
MEAKDFITLFLGISTAILGVIAHRATVKKRFIETVTTQRVIWIEKLRQDIATFCGLTHTWVYLEDAKADDPRLQELDRLRYVIRLRLNPNDEPGSRIERILQAIPDLTHESQRDKLKGKIDEMVIASQCLIKAEWDKVKDEAEKGRLKKGRE